MKSVMIPTIHLNGTSKNTLFEQLREAAHALKAASVSLAKAAPHARDYYVQDGNAYKKAADDHVRRLNALKEVYEEVMTIWEGVANQ